MRLHLRSGVWVGPIYIIDVSALYRDDVVWRGSKPVCSTTRRDGVLCTGLRHPTHPCHPFSYLLFNTSQVEQDKFGCALEPCMLDDQRLQFRA